MKRDNKGRFNKGNSGGPGRPSRPTEVAYLNILMKECSLEDWGKITAQAVSDAKAGDSKAREWLGKHLIGAVKSEAPTPMIVQQFDLSGIDPVYLERARSINTGTALITDDLFVNQVEKNEQTAKVLMEEDE